MIRLFSILLVFSVVSIASTKAIDTKIQLNKKILNKKKSQQKQTKTKIKTLAKYIKKQEQEYKKIEKKLSKINNNIFLNKVTLNSVKSEIVNLEKNTKNVQKQKLETEEDIVETIIDKYSASLGVQLASKQSADEIVDKEVYSILLENSKSDILKLNLEYLKLSNTQRKNQTRTVKIAKYIKKQEEEKIKFKNLKRKKQDVIAKLSKQHKNYQKQLKNIIARQEKLSDLLSSLNIVKKKALKKAQRAKKERLKAKQKKEKLAKAKKKETTKKVKVLSKKKLDKEIDIEVRNIGSSSKGIKISRYNGKKTIAPLKSYKIVKKFGKYFDPVYKIELFHEAISMKPKKPNAKVYNVLKGKIVYAKKNSGTLENVVIVQHKNGLHTVYSHLDKIAPTLKIGKWIKKGFVVGRVSDTLMFQATKNGKYIDPKRLFR